MAWVTFECSDEQRSRWFLAAQRSNAGVSEWMCARLDAVEGLPRVYERPAEAFVLAVDPLDIDIAL